MQIKELIVVEGKNDSARIKEAVQADTIETSGMGLSKTTLSYIKEVQKRRGIIIFTDPDIPGEKIRQRINQEIPGCKNAFLMKSQAKTTKKVGVEHASNEAIQEALKHLITYQMVIPTISYQDFVQLGFTGQSGSRELRVRIGKRYHLGECNAKTLWKRLNLLQISLQELKREVMEGER